MSSFKAMCDDPTILTIPFPSGKKRLCCVTNTRNLKKPSTFLTPTIWQRTTSLMRLRRLTISLVNIRVK